MVVACFLLANLAYHHLELGKRIVYPFFRVLVMAGLFAVVVVFLLERTGAYRSGISLLRVRETERIIRASIQAAAALFVISYLVNFLVSRWLLVFAVTLVPFSLLVEKHLLSRYLHDLQARGRQTERVLILGAGMTGRRLFSALSRSTKLAMEPIALVDDDPKLTGSTIFEHSYQRQRSALVIPGPLSAQLMREWQADRVVIAVPSLPAEKLNQIAREAEEAGVTLSFVPLGEGAAGLWIDYAEVDGMLLATYRTANDLLEDEIIKRCFDFVVSLLAIIVLSPLLVTIAILIRRSSPGAAFFVQDRVGKNGKIFRLLKFRTMYVEADAYAKSPTDTSDPRITAIGRYLRRTSLDELPQLFNVLRGEISLVGPRPEMPFIVEQYLPLHRQRLTVKPGLTGVWQLSADRAYSIHENIEYDLYYIRHRNFFMDLAIVLHTLLFAARGI